MIGIDLERDGDGASVVVRDSGHGIEPELLPRVFDPFTQGDHSLHRTPGGLGIGLALVKRIVELHGGEVLARSAGSELGSEFEVRLPCWTGDAPADSELDAALEPGPHRRVLIVEDNVDAADTLRTHCVDGITANTDVCRHYVEYSIGTVTALNPVIGYERATALAAEAMRTGRGILELVREKKVLTEEQIAKVLDPLAMTGQGRPA